MVDLKTINNILNNLRRFQQKAAILAGFSQDEFLQDFTRVESAKHLLQVSVQSCLDIAHHIVADEGFRSPQDSYDAFLVLNEESILPDEIMPTLRQMVSFRNRLVHLYWEVDDALVYDILQRHLIDFDIYISHIISFVEARSK